MLVRVPVVPAPRCSINGRIWGGRTSCIARFKGLALGRMVGLSGVLMLWVPGRWFPCLNDEVITCSAGVSLSE